MKTISKQANTDSFHVDSINDIIQTNKNTAGGINKITNKILKLLNYQQLNILTKHINYMWNHQLYPDSWKEIKAVAFPKPNKDQENLNNYRIISLLNVFHKIFGKLLKHKINNHILHNKLLPADSYGFREGLGVNEYCVRLVQILEKNKTKNLGSIVLTIDISKAFDKINLNTLSDKLKHMNFEDKYIYWIMESLRHRKVTIGEGNNMTHTTLIEGLPQGDVLSPILFNLYTAEIHELKNEHIDILQYADDFTFIIKYKNMIELNTKANKLMTDIKIKLEKLNFKINVDKCKYMCVKCSIHHQMHVYLNNAEIKRENNLKILGVTFDDKINFNRHNRNIKDNIMKYINVLKIFNYKRGGAHPKSLLNLHNALIKSRTTFASPCIGTDRKNINNSLQIIHNTSLRLCLGMTKTTPITAILGEAAEWPIELIHKWLNVKFVIKHLYSNTQIGKDLKNNSCTKLLNDIYTEFPIFKHVPVIETNLLTQQNLFINKTIKNYNKSFTNIEKKYLATNIIEEFADSHHIYTDGSKTDDGIVGLGILFDDTKEKIQLFMEANISIKSTELIAIFIAIKMAIAMNKKNIVILTDSQSSCISLLNSIKKIQKKKYYENKIIKMANENKDKKITIQWIPAHVGIEGNEQADKLASDRTNINANNTLAEFPIPPEDILNICKYTIHKTWTDKFEEITTYKGTYHANIMKQPTLKPWFYKINNLDSSQLKQIIRVRTGHTFDKKHLHMIKMIDNNLCENCGVIETAEHLIDTCTLHETTRQKYTDIKRRGLSEILRIGDGAQLATIPSYLNEINHKL